MTHLLTAILVTMMATPASAQSIEEEIEIEAVGAMSDSEAALQEAKDAERYARDEKRKAQKSVAQSKVQISQARRKEKDYQRRIVKAEKDRAKAAKETERAMEQMEVSKAKTAAIYEDLEKERLKVEAANADRTLALEKKGMADEKMKQAKEEMAKMQEKFRGVKKEELAAKKDLKKSEVALKKLEKKTQLSYENADKEAAGFLSAVEDHRSELNDISKKLDEMEIEVETDRNFIAEERLKSPTSKLTGKMKRTPTRVARVNTSKCNVRSAPGRRAKVLGKHRRGRKMRVRKHNATWYSVIHNGEKAFMGTGCFKN